MSLAPPAAPPSGPDAAGAPGRSSPRSRLPRAAWPALALALVALAFVVRLAYLDATPGYVPLHDAVDYDVHAQSIARGEGFSDTIAYGRPTAFRPPGYPYFLAGVYELTGVEVARRVERVEKARFAQVLVGTAVVALMGLLALQLWGRTVALVTLALGTVYVPLIIVGGAMMSEPLFLVPMLGALIAAVQHRRSRRRYAYAVLAGVLGGAAILTRANAVVLLVPLAFAVWDLRPRLSWRSLGPPAALVVAALLAVTPWTVRNARVFDTFVPVSTQLGSALAGTYNDAARTDRLNPASWRSVKWVPQYQHIFGKVRETPEPELERELRAAALRYAADHPTYVAEVAWWSTLRMFELAGLDRSRATAATITVEREWADRGVICFWAFVVLAVAGLLSPAVRRAPAFVWAVPAVLFASVVFLVVETPRYRTPLDPFVIMLAALGVTSLAGLVGRRGRSRRRGGLRSAGGSGSAGDSGSAGGGPPA